MFAPPGGRRRRLFVNQLRRYHAEQRLRGKQNPKKPTNYAGYRNPYHWGVTTDQCRYWCAQLKQCYSFSLCWENSEEANKKLYHCTLYNMYFTKYSGRRSQQCHQYFLAP